MVYLLGLKLGQKFHPANDHNTTTHSSPISKHITRNVAIHLNKIGKMTTQLVSPTAIEQVTHQSNISQSLGINNPNLFKTDKIICQICGKGPIST